MEKVSLLCLFVAKLPLLICLEAECRSKFQAGTLKLKDAGWPFIIVLGHPNFYPRFGFKAAGTLGITCEWEVPEDVFMVLMLDQEKMRVFQD